MLDYIVVGFGLGGASLAFHLENKKRNFLIFDDGTMNSSKVAGGMINPVVLKRFSMAWNADEQMEVGLSFYQELEKHLGVNFLKPVELYRKFASVEEQNNWFSATDNPLLAPYLDTKLEERINASIPGDFSFGRVLGAHRVDTTKMLDTYANFLKDKDLLRTETFNYKELEIAEDHLAYKGRKTRSIIFCEGFGMRKNPFFSYLPLVGNKGEYIIIHAPELKLEVVVKSAVFISPVGNDRYVVGATYNHSDKEVGATQEARAELENKLIKMIQVPYQVIDQISGIRPSTIDRKPLVGRHPQLMNLYCCNGFGSRGVLAAPTVTKKLLDTIENEQALPSEIDLSRFTRKYFQKSSSISPSPGSDRS